MKPQLIRSGLVTTVLMLGCGGATSIDKDEYPDDGYGLGWEPGDPTGGTGGATVVDTRGGGHTSTGPGSQGGSTGTIKTSSKGGTTSWITTKSRGGSTGGIRTASKGGTTSWTTSKGGSTAKGGTTSRSTTMSKGGVGNWSSTSMGTGGGTNWTTTKPIYCRYGDSIYSLGSSFIAEDGCTSCYCDYDGGVSCFTTECSCVYFGFDLWTGDSVIARDGCNECKCQPGGGVSCTTSPCPSACTYAGRTYANGDWFLAVDGCNKCSCADGVTTCSEMDCKCDTQQEYWRQYIAYSPNECASITYRCQPGSTPFSNACGCGCEQSPDCPASFFCPSQYGGVGGATGTLPGYSGGAPGTGGAGTTYYAPGCDSAQQEACPLSSISTLLF